MEINQEMTGKPIRAVLFDFDGTLSTLRGGWEDVMLRMMLAELAEYEGDRAALEADLREYIGASAGIQTYFQMAWFAGEVGRRLGSEWAKDPWTYKDIYNQELMDTVNRRIRALESGEVQTEQYLVRGSRAFLEALKAAGLTLYVASGTDEADVQHEAGILGLDRYFRKIAGAPHREASCPKEKVLAEIIRLYEPEEMLVVGDGKVEIALGSALGCRTLGIASFEDGRPGINLAKQERLITAGSGAIVSDFSDLELLLAYAGVSVENDAERK